MAFLGVVADLANAAVESYGASYARAMLPGILNAGVAEGYSGAEMLGQLRSAGLGIRTQTFYQILGNVNLAEQTGFANLGAPLDTIPGPGEVARFLTVRAQGYLYNARYLLQTIDPDTGATATEWRPFSLHYDNLVTRGDALQDTIDILNQSQAEAALEGSTAPQGKILGVEIANIYNMQPSQGAT